MENQKVTDNNVDNGNVATEDAAEQLVRLVVGETETAGVFVVGIALIREQQGFKSEASISGKQITPYELVAMIEAVTNLRESLVENLIATVSDTDAPSVVH